MKTFNTVLGLILLIAVGYLFVREFSGTEESNEAAGADQVEEALKGDAFGRARLAYVNSDSLVAKYDLHKELKNQLEAKAKVLEEDLASKSEVFQENVAILQQQAGRLSQEELQAAQLDLQQTQQQLQLYADGKSRELALEERKLDSLLMRDVDSVLEAIKQEFDLDYVFSYSRQSSVLSANKDFDITPLVVKRLNAANRKKKEAAATEEE